MDASRQPAHRSGARRAAAATLAFLLLAVVVTAVSLVPVPVGTARAAMSPRALAGVGASPVKVPGSPVGKQLDWLLGIANRLPLSSEEISDHFDAAILAQVTPAELNEGLASLGPPGSSVTLLQLSKVEERSLLALVQIGRGRYSVELAVDASGLIAHLLFRPVAAPMPASWPGIDHQVAGLAPEVSFLAAKVNRNGTCGPVNSVLAGTPRPLGSMFKLFVLGALANAVREHRVSWDEQLRVTAGIKVGGSGTIQDAPVGTKLSVEATALKMISISDNTAADMLLKLVTRSAVEEQVQAWSSHASLDVPFLTVSEMFALKYHDFPALADHYLSLRGRADRKIAL
jgi:hypothetical protein